MTDQFPGLLKAAAETFTNSCTAFAQFRVERINNQNVFKARLQATEIMKQFVGDVRFGQDPKGILFYRHVFDFAVSRVDFDFQRYNGPRDTLTVRMDFRDEGAAHVFARFLARFDIKKYPIPPIQTSVGRGRWTEFKAATVQVDAIRQQGSQRLYLQLPPIWKEVYFNTSGVSSIRAPGILIFRDLKRLKNKPLEEEGDSRPLLADYSPDRIVLHLKTKVATEKPKEFGLFLPADPLQGLGTSPVQAPETTWRDFEPDMGRRLDAAEEEGEDPDEDN